MKFNVKITQTLEGYAEIEAENAEAALKAAQKIYDGGAPLPDMEDTHPLKFSLDTAKTKEATIEPPSWDEVERYLKNEGYPDTSRFMVEHFVYGDNKAMFDEAVTNNYSMHEVQRWAHLKGVLGNNLSFRAAMMIDTALWVEDAETMEMTSKEDILGTPTGVCKKRLEKLAAEYAAGKKTYQKLRNLSDDDVKFLIDAFGDALYPERKPTMDICIYQINKDRDKQRLTFMDYNFIALHQGGGIDASMYDKVYESVVQAKTLEDVYYIFNQKHPADYRSRSLSMSDVVEVKEDGTSHFYFCDTIGFRRINFDSQLTQTRSGVKPSLSSQISACASRVNESGTESKNMSRADKER